jgi:hypothetical protein
LLSSSQNNPQPQTFQTLAEKFPTFAAPFLASQANFAHFGHNLRFFGLIIEKFPAKIPGPGNLAPAAFARFGSTITPRAGVDRNSFPHPLFSAICSSRGSERL